jgi:o-succinylbenzoate synthase
MGSPSISVTPLALALRSPLVTARGHYLRREGFLVSLTGPDGAQGRGEAMPLPAFGTEPPQACHEALERFCARGRAVPERPEALAGWLAGLTSTPAARHALELAALEVQARRAGLPLARWLASAVPEVPAPRARAEVNALLSSRAPGPLAEEGAAAVSRGFRTLKVKVAGAPLAEDVARLRALRAAVGPRVRLRIDANGAWQPDEARAALEVLGEVGLELCEQPVAEHDVAGLGALRGSVPCAVAADEALALPARARAVLEARAADVLVLKPMVLGGLLPALALAQEAARVGMAAYVTSVLDGVVARAGAAHLAAVLPRVPSPPASGLAVGHLFVDEPQHPYAPVAGAILLPDAPGLGLDRAGESER